MHVMRIVLIVTLLAGCSATVSQQIDGTGILAPKRNLTQSGSTFLGKFSTVSALNTKRLFVADYHGEIRFTVFENEKINCRFWANGRVTDRTIYDGINGFIKAYSTLCSGRLQHDNTFEFQGAYMLESPHVATGETLENEEQTFTIRGNYTGETMVGDLVIGSVFRNDELLDLREGVRFEAVLLE